MPRLNFTGRRRISHNHVRITVTGIGGIETFSAELDLAGYDFPSDARVIVEAWRQLELLRFDFGTIGLPQTPASCRLSEFGTAAGLRFRVKVVSADAPRGRLLGVADRIHPTDVQQESLLRVPLLVVRSRDLGREIWKLEFCDEPVMVVNHRLARSKSLVQSTEFQSLVLPEVLRSVLNRIILINEVRVLDETDDWTARWLRFAISLPGVEPIPEEGGAEADLEWIDSVVGSFCRWRGVDRQFTTFWRETLD